MPVKTPVAPAPTKTGLSLSIAQPTLLHLLAAERVVENRPSIPILAHLLLDASNDELTVEGSSIAMTIITNAPCQVEHAGRIALPAATLVAVVSTFERHALVEIEVDEETRTATLTCGKAVAEIKGVAPDDFPQTEHFEARVSLSVNAEKFCGGVRATLYAADQKDDLKPILSSLAMRFTDDGLYFLATDSLRSAAHVLTEYRQERPFDLVVQQRFMREMEAIFRANGDSDITLSVGKTPTSGGEMVCFEAAGLRFYCQAQGIEPRLKPALMQMPTTCRIEVDSATFVRVLERTAIFARDDEFKVYLSFTSRSLDVRGSGKERGQAFDSIPGELMGDPMDVACNLEYLKQALDNFNAKRISIETSGVGTAIVLRSPDRLNQFAAISPIGRKQGNG